jgi:hypothetical protein
MAQSSMDANTNSNIRKLRNRVSRRKSVAVQSLKALDKERPFGRRLKFGFKLLHVED